MYVHTCVYIYIYITITIYIYIYVYIIDPIVHTLHSTLYTVAKLGSLFAASESQLWSIPGRIRRSGANCLCPVVLCPYLFIIIISSIIINNKTIIIIIIIIISSSSSSAYIHIYIYIYIVAAQNLTMPRCRRAARTAPFRVCFPYI